MRTFLTLMLFCAYSIVSMAQSKNIVEVAMGSEDHTILVAAVSAAGLAPVLQGEGPFTVFAPDNAAFHKLPAGTVESLLLPENKDALTSVLTYHVVSGNLDAATVLAAIEAGKGKAELTTVQGSKLVGSLDDGKVKLTDANGNSVYVKATDLKASNGVIHVIDGVVLPK